MGILWAHTGAIGCIVLRVYKVKVYVCVYCCLLFCYRFVLHVPVAENNTSVGQHPRDGNTPPPERGISVFTYQIRVSQAFSNMVYVCIIYVLELVISPDNQFILH